MFKCTSLVSISLDAFCDEIHETFGVLVRVDGGDFCPRSVFHSLGGLGGALLHAVLREDINQGHEVDLSLSFF